MKNYKKLVTLLIAVWFVFALSASALSVFQNPDNRIGLAVALAASVPLILFVAWFSFSTGFRQFAMSLSPTALTAVQTGRIVGFTFVLLEAHRDLPAIFAFPAGYGDMFIGATACYAAWKLANANHRNSFILWQILGVIDLFTAVGLGTTARLIDPQSIAMTPMTVLPLSLIPTFLVPLFLIFHFICIAQARGWRSDPLPGHSGRFVGQAI